MRWKREKPLPYGSDIAAEGAQNRRGKEFFDYGANYFWRGGAKAWAVGEYGRKIFWRFGRNSLIGGLATHS